MKLALISARPTIANKTKNIQIMENYINKIKADIYIFGEYFLSGDRCKDEFRDLAEPLNGPSIQFLKKIAKNKQCYIVFGMPTKDDKVDGLIYNASVLIHPNGTVDAYKKWFLPTAGPFEEKIFFDQGEELPVFNTIFGKIGLLICYDLNFPELAKALTLQGADLLICISASPTTTRKYFEILLPARALENTVFVAYVNLAGNQEDLIYWAGSQVYDPLGNLIIKAPYFKESIITCDINFKQLEPARARRPVLRDIRPEIYQDLYQFSRFHTKKEPPE
ncbi:MAG: carbon-nitrogen hydrolase family protein [Thermoplasmata archaeon]|nr:carbon-nitrogen hydrolase family protein [Thermoplasmata archaeon]MBE3136056.1 carbon-nitrogen hydrolase family protein [Thermoplasmata archaeon]MBE3139326.1 carbon-nitrogen hydrolase family protein [Thermoplasmata archaeon]